MVYEHWPSIPFGVTAGQARRSRASSASSHSAAGGTLRSYAKLCCLGSVFFPVCGSEKHKLEKEKVEAGRERQTKHLGEKTSLIRGARCSAFPPSLPRALCSPVARAFSELTSSRCRFFGRVSSGLNRMQSKGRAADAHGT